MVGVIVGVEDEADGLIGGLAKIGKDFARAPWVVGVDDQHVVAEDDPAGIGDDALVGLGKADEHAGGDFADEA